MQQEWMASINNYFQQEDSACATSCYTDKEELYKIWHTVFNSATKSGYSLDSKEERIVVCTLCYIVYNLTVDKVKDYKAEQVLQTETATTATTPSTSGTSSIQLKESNVNGFTIANGKK